MRLQSAKCQPESEDENSSWWNNMLEKVEDKTNPEKISVEDGQCDLCCVPLAWDAPDQEKRLYPHYLESASGISIGMFLTRQRL